jgi:hypothetical protein
MAGQRMIPLDYSTPLRARSSVMHVSSSRLNRTRPQRSARRFCSATRTASSGCEKHKSNLEPRQPCWLAPQPLPIGDSMSVGRLLQTARELVRWKHLASGVWQTSTSGDGRAGMMLSKGLFHAIKASVNCALPPTLTEHPSRYILHAIHCTTPNWIDEFSCWSLFGGCRGAAFTSALLRMSFSSSRSRIASLIARDTLCRFLQT